MATRFLVNLKKKKDFRAFFKDYYFEKNISLNQKETFKKKNKYVI